MGICSTKIFEKTLFQNFKRLILVCVSIAYYRHALSFISYLIETMSQSTMSTSSSSRATASADESGYVTVIPRRNPPASVEEDPSEDTEDTGNSVEISNDNAPSQRREASPTSVLPQPPLYGLRIRRTARKSVPIPGRIPASTAGHGTAGPSGAEPSDAGPRAPSPQQVIGIPVRQPGMTPEESRRLQSIAAGLRHSLAVIAGHREVLDEVLAGMEILYQHSMETANTASAARREAGHAMTAYYVFGGLFLIVVLMLLVGIAIGFWF